MLHIYSPLKKERSREWKSARSCWTKLVSPLPFPLDISLLFPDYCAQPRVRYAFVYSVWEIAQFTFLQGIACKHALDGARCNTRRILYDGVQNGESQKKELTPLTSFSPSLYSANFPPSVQILPHPRNRRTFLYRAQSNACCNIAVRCCLNF